MKTDKKIEKIAKKIMIALGYDDFKTDFRKEMVKKIETVLNTEVQKAEIKGVEKCVDIINTMERNKQISKRYCGGDNYKKG